MDIAVDSSVLVALLDPRDVWRDQSMALERALIRAGMAPVYFDCVAAEAVSAAARRLREKGRAAEVSALLDRLNERVGCSTLSGGPQCASYFRLEVASVPRPTTRIVITA